jgi:hypothetical protein
MLPCMPDAQTPTPQPTSSPSATQGAVADTMRRVHEQLRRGAAPSFESLLAFGEPA